MREIKFRFWSKILNYFVVPDDDVFVGALKDEYMIVMQYTGLKDKNGKEIYEGDIVKPIVGSTWKTSWADKEAKFRLEREGEDSLALGEGNNQLEVVGNIYENPELI